MSRPTTERFDPSPDHEEPFEDRVPDRLSPSGFSLWTECRRRWLYRYIGKLPDPAGRPALLGSFAHAILEILFQFPPDERTEPFARFASALAWKAFSEEDEWKAFGPPDPAELRMFKWDAYNAVVAALKMEDAQNVDVISVEQKFDDVVLGGAPFRGYVDRIDRIEGGERIVDYKTGKVPPKKFRNDKLKQVILYAAAVRARTGKLPIVARLMFPVFATNLTITVTDKLADATVAEFGLAWQQIRSALAIGEANVGRVAAGETPVSIDTAFPTNPKMLCGWCPYLAECDDGLREVRQHADNGRLKPHAPAWALLGEDRIDS